MQEMEKDTLLLDDLPEPLRTYAEIIGLESLKELARREGGKTLYIPTVECLNKHGYKRRIRKEYNGKNIHELEKKYGLSNSTIYKYLNRQSDY